MSSESRGEPAGEGAYGALSPSTFISKDKISWLRKTATWLETSDDTDPALWAVWCCECEDEFRPRRLKAPFVLVWVVFQVVGTFFQAAMLTEIWRHLDSYERTLATNCSPEHEHDGVCLGPSWNMTFSGTLDFPPTDGGEQGDFDFIIPADKVFTFKTYSQPPTFLVGVEALTPHVDLRWKLSLAELGSLGGPLPQLTGHGKRYTVVVRKPGAASGAERQFEGSMTLLSKLSDAAQIHLYAIDSRIQHLEDIHRQEQCSFEASWQNFNERSNGHHHQVLFTTWRATAFFLVLSLASTGLVLRRFFYFVEGGKLLSRMIVAKFVVQDFPQQLCIIAYLYAWYANNGLRCQMCLFHPQHCDDEYPLHWSNLVLCVFTLLSACANQLLLQVKAGRTYDEEEEFFLCFFRFALVSLSTLPFSTAMLLLSAPLLQLRSAWIYMIFGAPCLIGWGTLFCLPMAVACEE